MAMDGSKIGLTAAVSACVAAAGGLGDVAGNAERQLELIEADAPLPLKPATAAGTAGKAGRPRGSSNISTRQWVEYLLTRYRSPLIGLAEIYSRDCRQLAAQLDCTPLEAFKVQQASMAALLPYVHKKQPMAVELEQRQLGVLTLNLGDGSTGSQIVFDSEAAEVLAE